MRANERRISRSDPDSSFIFREGKSVMMAYKVHLATDCGAEHIITVIKATPGETGNAETLPSLIWQHASLVGTMPKEAVADAIYGTKDVYAFSRGLGIPPSMPRKKSQGGRWLAVSSFTYDAERDVFVCPEGKTLEGGQRSRRVTDMYRAKRSSCKHCPRKPACTKGERCAIKFCSEDEVLLWAFSHLKTAKARESLRKGKVWVEGGHCRPERATRTGKSQIQGQGESGDTGLSQRRRT
jgi:hypothetical protein